VKYTMTATVPYSVNKFWTVFFTGCRERVLGSYSRTTVNHDPVSPFPVS
jgi:hypothetical protein